VRERERERKKEKNKQQAQIAVTWLLLLSRQTKNGVHFHSSLEKRMREKEEK
jgi:hypothetical protein